MFFRTPMTPNLTIPISEEQSWLGKFGQRDKWSFCLTAARMAAEQEKR